MSIGDWIKGASAVGRQMFLQPSNPSRVASVAASAFLGQVSTRCQVPISFSGSAKQIMARTKHVMRDSVSAFKVVYSAGYVPNSAGYYERGPQADTTIHLSVEYPAGVFTRVEWNGNEYGLIPDKGHLASDFIHLQIPDGADFWLWVWLSNPIGGCFLFNKQCADTGDGLGDFYASGTTVTDSSDGTPFVSTSTTSIVLPSAIIAYTTKASVLIVGDSRSVGGNISPNDTPDMATDGLTGTVERAIGDDLPYINIGVRGDTAMAFRATNKWRLDLAKYTTSVIYGYGINDISAGRSSALLANDRNGFLKAVPAGKPVYLLTITPLTTSSDNWATTENQSIPSAGKEIVRETENTARRAVPAGFSGCFDVAGVLETAITGGKGWVVDGTARYATGDGTHETKVGNVLVKTAGVIDLAVLQATAPSAPSQLISANKIVNYQTANLTVKPEQASEVFTNEGATSKPVFTLPTPYLGCEFTFVVQDADGLRVSAVAGSTIRIAGSVSADAGFVEATTIGNTVTLLAINTSEWVATAVNGTWTVT